MKRRGKEGKGNLRKKITMKKKKIKSIFVSPERPKAQDNKTGINFINLKKNVTNCLLYDAIHEFLIWLRTSSNPMDLNRFLSIYLGF